MGDVFGSGVLSVSEEEIVAFAREFDPQPFHLSADEAVGTFFGRLVASGWHTAALTIRLMTGGELELAGGMIGLGIDGISWPRPVLPGDALRLESEILEMRVSRSRPDWGILKIRHRTLNQRGEEVQVMVANQMVLLRRP